MKYLRSTDVRPFVILLLVLLSSSVSLAYRQRCSVNDQCAEGNIPALTDSPNPPPGQGSPPVIDPVEMEAFRSSDISATGVVLSTGEFQLTVTDMEIPGRGFPFRLTRTYRSRRDGERSVLGFNWDLNYDEYLTPGTAPGENTITRVAWKMGDGFTGLWMFDAGLGRYKAFNGFFGMLRDLGTNGPYQIRYPDGTIKTFETEGRVSGNRVWFLTRIEDRNGNAMIFQIAEPGVIGTVTDTLGRVVSFPVKLTVDNCTPGVVEASAGTPGATFGRDCREAAPCCSPRSTRPSASAPPGAIRTGRHPAPPRGRCD